MLILIIVLVLVFGLGGGYYGHTRWGPSGGAGIGLGDNIVDSPHRLHAWLVPLKANDIVRDGGAVVVPAGTYHNVINTSKTTQLKLYTVYSPPNHPAGTVHVTKAEADAEHHEVAR